MCGESFFERLDHLLMIFMYSRKRESSLLTNVSAEYR